MSRAYTRIGKSQCFMISREAYTFLVRRSTAVKVLNVLQSLACEISILVKLILCMLLLPYIYIVDSMCVCVWGGGGGEKYNSYCMLRVHKADSL